MIYLINFILLFRPNHYEYRNCDYYGRRSLMFKTLFGHKYYARKWEDADLLWTK